MAELACELQAEGPKIMSSTGTPKKRAIILARSSPGVLKPSSYKAIEDAENPIPSSLRRFSSSANWRWLSRRAFRNSARVYILTHLLACNPSAASILIIVAMRKHVKGVSTKNLRKDEIKNSFKKFFASFISNRYNP